MISMDIHDCVKVTVSKNDNMGVEWTDLVLKDKEGNDIMTLALYGPPELELAKVKDAFINHKNGDVNDNSIDNLEIINKIPSAKDLKDEKKLDDARDYLQEVKVMRREQGHVE